MTKARIHYKLFFAFTVIIVVPVLAIAFIVSSFSGSVEKAREEERFHYARSFLLRRLSERQSYLNARMELLAKDSRMVLPKADAHANSRLYLVAALAAEYGLDGLSAVSQDGVELRWLKPDLSDAGVRLQAVSAVWVDPKGIRLSNAQLHESGYLVAGLASIGLEEFIMLRDTLGIELELVKADGPDRHSLVMSTRPDSQRAALDVSLCPPADASHPVGIAAVLTDARGNRFSVRSIALPASIAAGYSAYLVIANQVRGIPVSVASLLTVAAAALVLAGAASFLLSKQIVRPLGILSAAVDGLSMRLENGQPFEPIPVEGSDELSELTRSFNTMGRNLADAHRDLVERNEDLRRMDKVKDDFLAETAKEIRTPLVSMVALVESLQPASGLNASQRATLALTARTGRRLHSMVDDILDFSRLEHDGLKLEMRVFKLRPLVESVLYFCRGLKRPEVELLNLVEPSLCAYADQSRVEQMLYHLLGNAVRYTGSGSVIVRAWEEIGRLFVSVRDTGPGLPAEIRQAIQVRNESTAGDMLIGSASPGTGLRLVSALAALHGGSLFVPDDEGRQAALGTELVFSVPAGEATQRIEHDPTAGGEAARDDADDSGLEELAALDTAAAVLPGAGTRRILVADDDPVNVRLILNGLGGCYDVRVCSDGTDAYRILAEEGLPGLIIIGSVLRMLSGFELCAALRREYPHLPIILAMQSMRPEDVSQAYASGAHDYVSKPISVVELRSRVAMLLSVSGIQESYGKFVPRAALSHMKVSDPASVRIGMSFDGLSCLLAADLQAFVAGLNGSEAVVAALNELYTRIGPLISRHGGYILHYGSTSFIALFQGSAHDARSALDAATELRRAMPAIVQHVGLSAQAADIPLGLHRGTVLLAALGESERHEISAISGAAGIAAELARTAGLYGALVLLSGDMLEAAESDESRLPVRYLGRDKTGGYPLYELLAPEEDKGIAAKLQTVAQFERTVAMFEAGKSDVAYASFMELAASCPDDTAWRVFMERIIADRERDITGH